MLRLLAHHGRYTLAAGLLAGLALPALAALLKPWVPHLIVLLLCLTAFRIGHHGALRGLRNAAHTLRTLLILQLGLPLLAIAGFALLGLSYTAEALAITLMLAAPALTGSPNLAIMLKADPEPAFRLLILGTALLPLTIIPIFWLSPQLGDFTTALWAAARLVAVLGTGMMISFVLRAKALPAPKDTTVEALDGVMVICLILTVVGLMGALGPALQKAPLAVLKWTVLVFAVNFGLQIITYLVTKNTPPHTEAVPFAVVAGNRNVALFLLALPLAQSEEFLIFLACSQLPIYLTPLLMRRFFAR